MLKIVLQHFEKPFNLFIGAYFQEIFRVFENQQDFIGIQILHFFDEFIQL